MLKDYEIDKPVLETNRLILREMCEDDVGDLSEWLGLDEVYTYWGRKASKGEMNPELFFIDARPWVVRKPKLDFKWVVVLKENNKVVGMVEIFDIQNYRMGDVAYRFHPDYWKRGLATEALKRVIEFIFKDTELDRLNARADVRNIGSNHVLQKCGFVKEGLIRHGKMVSIYCDYNIYGFLSEDYISQ
ncbi:GNAT family N-acetyltransferase [Anaeromicropila herbilytica]|uniref:GNAT family acetyltransferase n=1 Tax=Anaeromicropila herbilytica TaxID=2785025 RepID=A0A7R7ELF2_9FIRM|nr:GNAT family protein [Anaeromicropila herbilytica]BCN30942.1 GNAT family acetyltransferase [Anaeromicropila herbilytica]